MSSFIDQLFLALHEGRYDHLEHLLKNFDPTSLDPRELPKVQRALQMVEERIREERGKILQQMQDLEKVKRFY
ncbi:MAG: hypothetical protein C6I00_05115 [Nitratiruptor sp.]|nr:hypothetical protein [Nitratiruptor sp.]NPA84291.1 hypothetical protein [Campylobacterota bacterium]